MPLPPLRHFWSPIRGPLRANREISHNVLSVSQPDTPMGARLAGASSNQPPKPFASRHGLDFDLGPLPRSEPALTLLRVPFWGVFDAPHRCQGR
eukprot:13732562-Alexandrium_andersonii.AAC.1